MQELRPGLWTWTAPHPERREADDWGPDVRSYAYDSGSHLVLFDPIAPPTLLEGMLEAQDVAVLLTAEWHRRSADECVERFGAHVYAPGDKPPAGVDLLPTYYDEEVAYWIPTHRALVAGDSLFGENGFRVQDQWLPPNVTREQMHAGLQPLRELPVELVLVTHGDPVTEDAYETLRAAIRT
jgi:hypothetical protein